MKKKEKLFFVAMFFLLGLIWLLILWPENNKPQVILTSTFSYTNTPTVTITVTPTQTYNPTATTIISPTLTITPTTTPTFIISITSTPYPIPESTGYRCDWWRWDRPMYECFVDKDYKSCYWKWCR